MIVTNMPTTMPFVPLGETLTSTRNSPSTQSEFARRWCPRLLQFALNSIDQRAGLGGKSRGAGEGSAVRETRVAYSVSCWWRCSRAVGWPMSGSGYSGGIDSGWGDERRPIWIGQMRVYIRILNLERRGWIVRFTIDCCLRRVGI